MQRRAGRPDPLDRESRLQVRTRAFNEWVEEATGGLGSGAEHDLYRCECGDCGCGRTVALTRAEYEDLRAYPNRFATTANHEGPTDTVVAEHDRYTIVEKLAGRPSRLARRTYPR